MTGHLVAAVAVTVLLAAVALWRIWRAANTGVRLSWLIRSWLGREACDLDVWRNRRVGHLLPLDEPHDREDDGDCTLCSPGRVVTEDDDGAWHVTWVHRSTRDRSIRP